MRLIALTEPCNYNPDNPDQIVILVSDQLYAQLLKGPQKCPEYYCIGPNYPDYEYIHLGNHIHSCNQSGFIDCSLMSQKCRKYGLCCDFEDRYGPTQYHNHDYLSRLRCTHPEILCLFSCPSSPESSYHNRIPVANLYGHYSDDSPHVLDSLRVDFGSYYPNDSENTEDLEESSPDDINPDINTDIDSDASSDIDSDARSDIDSDARSDIDSTEDPDPYANIDMNDDSESNPIGNFRYNSVRETNIDLLQGQKVDVYPDRNPGEFAARMTAFEETEREIEEEFEESPMEETGQPTRLEIVEEYLEEPEVEITPLLQQAEEIIVSEFYDPSSQEDEIIKEDIEEVVEDAMDVGDDIYEFVDVSQITPEEPIVYMMMVDTFRRNRGMDYVLMNGTEMNILSKGEEEDPSAWYLTHDKYYEDNHFHGAFEADRDYNYYDATSEDIEKNYEETYYNPNDILAYENFIHYEIGLDTNYSEYHRIN